MLLTAAIGDALCPHPQWSGLARTWTELYPTSSIADEHRANLERLVRTIPTSSES